MRRFVIAGAVLCGLLLARGAMAIAPGWSIQQTPNPTGGSNSALDGVSCVLARACTAVGSSSRGTLAERWNGTKWTIERTPSTGRDHFLQRVSCVSASSCIAVGSYLSRITAAGAMLVERWDGAKWSVEPTPTPSGRSVLTGVSCVSASACTA